jgi:hypothetical protein
MTCCILELRINLSHLEQFHEVHVPQGSRRNRRFGVFNVRRRGRLLHGRRSLLRWHASVLLVSSQNQGEQFLPWSRGNAPSASIKRSAAQALVPAERL